MDKLRVPAREKNVFINHWRGKMAKTAGTGSAAIIILTRVKTWKQR